MALATKGLGHQWLGQLIALATKIWGKPTAWITDCQQLIAINSCGFNTVAKGAPAARNIDG